MIECHVATLAHFVYRVNLNVARIWFVDWRILTIPTQSVFYFVNLFFRLAYVVRSTRFVIENEKIDKETQNEQNDPGGCVFLKLEKRFQVSYGVNFYQRTYGLDLRLAFSIFLAG